MNLRVKEVCKENGITVTLLSERLGIKQESLSRAINGNPTVETLEKIASTLNVPITELFEQPTTDIVNCPYCGGKIKVSKE